MKYLDTQNYPHKHSTFREMDYPYPHSNICVNTDI